MIDSILYQQKNKHEATAQIGTVYETLDKPIWHNFTDMTITRSKAIDLFQGKVKVIAKEGNTIISNCKEIRQKYHKDPRKMTVLSFDKLQRSEEPLSKIGFIGGSDV